MISAIAGIDVAYVSSLWPSHINIFIEGIKCFFLYVKIIANEELFSRLDGTYVQEDSNFPRVASNVPPKSNEAIIQHPQFELVGHSIVSISAIS